LQPGIGDHGIIGDLHTAALVSLDGSIDWLCLPDFDSPSLFASLLDAEKGGEFRISPAVERVTCKQFYWPDTNILVTRFLSPDGVGEITDYMPLGESESGPREHQIVRHLRVLRGEMPFHVDCRPAFNFARERHEVKPNGSDGVIFHAPTLRVQLATSVPLQVGEKGGVRAQLALREGESAVFLLRMLTADRQPVAALDIEAEHALFSATANYWRRWVSHCTYHGRWREMVQRSALALKLLTCDATGALVAAPTCSLPEAIGGERNWDYRYTWIRDAAFTLYALLRIGFTEEAQKFMQWIEARCHDLNPDGSLQTMYGLDGRHELKEEALDHLAGYRGSRPVRIGNDAYRQLQLDIYGALMDSVYLYNKYGNPISYELWRELRRLLNWVADNWRRDDCGIWEVRGGPQPFVYSKLMCWVALDRGVRLADKRSFPADRERWLKERDAIYEEVFTKGWSAKRRAFVQHYGSDALDSSTLIMPLVFFMSPADPRMLQTMDAIRQPLSRGGLMADSLVYRYDLREAAADGLAGSEGTFNICTFWMVEALTRAGRVNPWRLDQARLVFEKMLGFANHLGLYSEETGSCGEALGNFPQALTHLGLISAAFNLNRALGGKDSLRG
jgi:GH15 family glucan-1,4-alpha-glucosidase